MMVPRRRISLAQAVLTWGGGRLISLLILGLSVWALCTMHDAPRWRVKWVEVAGCSLVSPERVVQAGDLAEAWVVSLEPEEVARRVEGVPGVVEARVSLGWPNRVRISVVEDEPLATVRTGGQEYWVSRYEGLIAPYGTAEGLPVLEFVGGDSGVPTLSRQLLSGLAAMRSTFPGYTEYLYRAGRGFEVRSERGYPVYLGDASDLSLKLEMLAALELDLEAQRRVPAFIDLCSVEGAYYR